MKDRLEVRRALAGLLIAALAGSAATADEAMVPLAGNPFDRPAWLSEARETPPGDPPPVRRRAIDLRATLVGGDRALVNVGGTILGVGEEIDGYRLVAVAEGEAAFADGEEIIRIAVNRNDMEEEDETE